jgi:hypothetical protein
LAEDERTGEDATTNKRRDEEMPTDERAGEEMPADEEVPAAGVILVAFEKLFAGGRGVRRFRNSGLRHVELPHGAILVEQNPKKSSEWAELARRGHRVAWAMREGKYLARVVDGEVTFLN